MQTFALRFVVWIFLISSALVAVYLDSVHKQCQSVSIVIAVFSSLCFFEFCSIVRIKGFNPPVYLPMFILALSFFVPNVEIALIIYLALGILLLGMSMESVAFCVLGYFYCGLLRFATMASQNDLVRSSSHFFYIFLLVVCKGNDTFAYLIGKLIGRHKIMPKLSPMKTWEGSIGGVVAGTVGGMLVIQFTPIAGKYSSMLLPLILFTCTATILGSVGDAIKSYLKRWAGVKNSGKIFADMGGFLDVCDSFLITAPFTYLVISLV